ncbi:serine/threonine-protein kinase SIK1-like [Brachyhypopomus gauderio]|uniref:serine/threonine-protein kinase SIK1-like n=1 Tax=Brachyhypopomus gauderio TaxID=698409 RepID=UPI004043347E
MVVMSEDRPLVPHSQPSKLLQVGFYEIICTLGKGNFAVVKLARHKITKTQVAIKIIDKTRLAAADVERLNREVQIMKLLDHPHIIKLYQVMETKNMLYLVTEYANNGEIFDYLASNGRLSEVEARRTFWQILLAVDYCHRRCIIHRDLKVENLLLDNNMNIKLADFGFGNFYVPGEPLSTWCGSPPYAAPEVFEGRKYEGPQLDIWSLGVVLYVLVCGTLPFVEATLPALKQSVTQGHFPVPHFMSQECENLIRGMLAVDPAKRISIAQVRQHWWMQPWPGHHLPNLHLLNLHRRAESYSEPVLSLMLTLGIDKEKTVDSLQNGSYNHFSAIYWLLLERMTKHGGQQQIRQTQDQSKGPACTVSQAERSVEVEPSIRQHRSVACPSRLRGTRISEEAGGENTGREEEQLPLDLTPESRETIRRHNASPPMSVGHPPSIVVDLVVDVPPASCLFSPGSSSSISSTSLTSSGAPSVASPDLCPAQEPLPFSSVSVRDPPPPSSVLGFHNTLQIPAFQEGRRTSDTSLTQGLGAFHQQLRRNIYMKYEPGLNKSSSPAQYVCTPTYSDSSGSVGASGLPGPSAHAHSWEIHSRPAEGIQDHQDHQIVHHLDYNRRDYDYHHHCHHPYQQQSLQMPFPPPPPPPLTTTVQENTVPLPPALAFRHLDYTLECDECSQQAPPPLTPSSPLAAAATWCASSRSSSWSPADSAALLLETRLRIGPRPQPYPRLQTSPQSFLGGFL